jgi:hypothetical protein
MIRFPVKTGMICRDEIDEMIDLLLGSRSPKPVAIVIVGRESELTDSLS